METKYGTSIIKDNECILLVETSIENGSDIMEAIQDMRMIDNLLIAERNHFLSFKTTRKTATGRYRKGSELSQIFENIITARAHNIEM